MSSQEEMHTNSALLKRFHSMSLRWKIRMFILAGFLVLAVLVLLSEGIFQKRSVIRNESNQISMLRAEKARLLENYFTRLSDRLASFSTDPGTQDMIRQFSAAFLQIDKDNFAMPGAETLEKVKTLVAGYYQSEILPNLHVANDADISVSSLVPSDPRQQVAQYLYLAGNPKPFGLKYTLNKASDGSTYSNLHGQFQPQMVKMAHESGISDILFVDYQTGYVVFSMHKNLDFGSNLYDGPFKNTGLAFAFKSALGLSHTGMVHITDESLYPPSLDKPTLFFSTPVFSGSEIMGVLVFSVEADRLDQILAIGRPGLENSSSLKNILVGDDLVYRSNDPEYRKFPGRYVRRLNRFTGNREITAILNRINSTAMVQPANIGNVAGIAQGRDTTFIYQTSLGRKVLCAAAPLTVPGLHWILASQIDRAEVLGPVRHQVWFLAGLFAVLFLVFYGLTYVVSGNLAERLEQLTSYLRDMAGVKSAPNGFEGDEISQALNAGNKLEMRIQNAEVYARELGDGNMERELVVNGKEDRFEATLNRLRDSLVARNYEEIARKEEEELRNWSSQGIALFNDIMRSDTNDLEKLCQNIIRNIIQYMSANQGGIFLLEKEDGVPFLNLTAAYAYDRQKFLKKRIGMGEGLAGTCAIEKKTILLAKIPDDYIEITSGLGGAKPACLLILPLKKEDEILGVIEIASFNLFKPHEVEFMEKISESIAAALVTVRLHVQTSMYLERFQQQAEEMKAQDEELRQNIEELQATHEQMERMKAEEEIHNQQMIKEIEDNRKMLLNVLEHIPGRVFVKDHNGAYLLLNSEVAKMFGKSVEEVLGSTDFDNHAPEEAKAYRQKDLEVIEKGAETFIQQENAGEEIRYLRTSKMPFYLPQFDKMGLLGIQYDVTDFVKMEMQYKDKEKELNLNQKLLIDILDKIPAKIFLKNEKGTFVVVNSAVASVYNKTPEEIIGTSDYDNHPDEDVDSWRKQELEIVAKGETTYVHLEKMQGLSRYLKTTKMPFLLATTGTTGLLGIQFDITDQKEMEEQIKQLKSEVEKLSKK